LPRNSATMLAVIAAIFITPYTLKIVEMLKKRG